MSTIAEIYGLRYKDNGLYFYIGSSIHPETRLKEHIRNAKYQKYNKRLANNINNRSNDVVLDVLDVVFENEDRYQIEKDWLTMLKLSNHPVVNAVDPTYHHKGNCLAIHSRGFLGKKHSDLSKERIREAKKKQIMSDDARKKMSLSKQGDKNPMYGKIGTRTGLHFNEDSLRKMSNSRSKTGVTQFTIIDWIMEDTTRIKMSANDIKSVFPLAGRSLIFFALEKARLMLNIPYVKHIHKGIYVSDVINWIEQDLSHRAFWGWGSIQDTIGGSSHMIAKAYKIIQDKYGIIRPKRTDKYYKC